MPKQSTNKNALPPLLEGTCSLRNISTARNGCDRATIIGWQYPNQRHALLG
jgi:hypothetical protein